PDKVCSQLKRVERCTKEIIQSADCRSTVNELLSYYARATNSPFLVHMGLRWRETSALVAGDWDQTVTLLGNYVTLLGTFDMPNTDSCHDVMRAGPSIVNLAGALLCA